MRGYAYYNGKITTLREAKIPIFDRSVFFGAGVYEMLIGKNGRLYLWQEHFDRLKKSAEKTGLSLPDEEKILSAASTLLKRASFPEYTLYIQLSVKDTERKHTLDQHASPTLLIILTEAELKKPDMPMRVAFFEDIRHKMCDVKSLNLLPNTIVATEAERKGCSEAVFFLEDGRITEGARSNILIIKEKTIYTHPKGKHILPGITRERILTLAKKINLPVKEVPFYRSDVFSADEILVTSTTKFARRVCEADGVMCGMRDAKTAFELSTILYTDFEKYCSATE